jgi:hypothetical protein
MESSQVKAEMKVFNKPDEVRKFPICKRWFSALGKVALLASAR